ncbi:secretion system protein E [Natronococcus pandeyae]|uniref:Secretion system protein E n=1 Tax=Natronococcus pandeyae TaxID=2055836 RepID=A0A8J8TPE9_9EURY|nr:ATPase, T2SS/T4P/T4SS family [Natronococcus pandeyae]TYL37686.1 secretion system protein E [Natronococcus pandeyae]
MAIDETDKSDAGRFSDGEASGPVSEADRSTEVESAPDVRVGEYTWAEFMEEHGHGSEVSALYPDESETEDQLGLDTDEPVEPSVPSGDDWEQVDFDPESYLGYHPDDLEDLITDIAGANGNVLNDIFLEYVDPETTPVTKDVWTWEHYKWEYYYDEDGNRPRDDDGEIVRHDREDALGFDPETLERRLAAGDDAAMELDDVIEERTVDVQEDLDEDEFFSTVAGNTTVTNRYDLEKAVPMEKKTHFREVERYWVNKPYACVVIFHSEKENEKKYYMIEPYRNEIETELQEFLSGKLRTAIKYSDEGVKEKASEEGRRTVIEEETRKLLERYDLFEKTSGSTEAGLLESITTLLDEDDEDDEDSGPSQLEGIAVRPEPAILEDDPDTMSEYQVEKLLYLLKRNFIGYERIDGIKHDINVEDISVDGYNSPVFVYHSEYEQIISNIYHGEDELDDFVVKLAQRSGKGISKRLPQVDATLPDGSRAQLTLGKEVSDHGTNYTIRQFKDVPFTPIDLVNWNTFSLEEMAFLWLAIENHKSLIFAGGTASGKTTSLNAVSLFIPSSAKIVSIEDTREVELPQRNWIASVTRPSFSDDSQGDVDEFDLLEAALRQRPDYIVMGEIRGEEGRTLFQVMSTGHTTYTTFHADSVDEVLKRFTTDPINVSKTMFTALDLVSIQTQTRVQGRKVRRNKSLTEINHYEAEHDEINVQDVYQWQAETDEYLRMGDSNTMEAIQFDRGWSTEKLEEELFKREVIIAYLIKNGLNTYAEVAATVQAFINDPDTILTLIANGQLEDSLDDLREMESVLIDVDQEKEELVPRPEATSETYNLSMDLLERAEESLFEEYRGQVPSGLASTLGDVEAESTIEVDGSDSEPVDFSSSIDDWEFDDDGDGFTTATSDATDAPSWLEDDDGFDVSAEAGTSSGDASSSAPAETAESESEPDGQPTETTAATGDVPAIGDGSETATEDDDPGTNSDDRSDPDGSETGPEILPTDDPDESDFGGLFDDMNETLEQLEAGDPPDESDESHETSASSATETEFTETDFDSIFDPSAPDEESTAAFSGEFQQAAADDASGESEPEAPPASESEGDRDAPSETGDATETNEASETDRTAETSDTTAAAETAEGDAEVPSIDVGTTDSPETETPAPPTIDVGGTDETASDGESIFETDAGEMDEDDAASDAGDGDGDPDGSIFRTEGAAENDTADTDEEPDA